MKKSRDGRLGLRAGRMFMGAAAFMLAVICRAGAAYAADTVSTVRLDFTDRYEVGVIMEPEIGSWNSDVEVESVAWSKNVEDWKPGTKVTATVTLSSDKEFLSSYGSRTLRVNGAMAQSAKRASDGTLVVKASYYPVVQLDSPDGTGWSSQDQTKATWKSVEYATGYEIRLYRDNYFVRTIDATGSSKDLSAYMNKEGVFYYEVRAVGRDADDKKYRKSSGYLTSSKQVIADLGLSDENWRNYSAGRKYMAEDGDFVTNRWEKISGKWYYFNEEGFAATGWKKLGETWYYLDEAGRMLTGWQEIEGIRYYLNEDGAMAVGWIEPEPGKWYYLNADGSMAHDTVIDGRKLNGAGYWVYE
ncbi:MAG: N-acetylmuramoyl-L-alanine amidase family protein [Lachnospiraceae bacterium]|nr:N-acetylmuramoyl-L-alanine amidase family protein [Lachnospiraceae bacterium]